MPLQFINGPSKAPVSWICCDVLCISLIPEFAIQKTIIVILLHERNWEVLLRRSSSNGADFVSYFDKIFAIGSRLWLQILPCLKQNLLPLAPALKLKHALSQSVNIPISTPMRNVHLLPTPDDIKLEIEHNAELCRSIYGVRLDILEVNNLIPVVRLIQVNNTYDRVYTQKELIIIGKEVLTPANSIIAKWHWRPLKLYGPPKDDTSPKESRP